MGRENKGLLVATTSYPNSKNPSAGAFVENFALAASRHLRVEVIAPSSKDSKLIKRKGFDVGVNAFRYAPNKFELLAQRGGGVPAAMKNRLNFLLVPLFIIGYFLTLTAFIRKVKYVQANWIFSGFLACLPVFVFRKKMIVTLHGEDFRKIQKSITHKLLFYITAQISNGIACVSEEMYEELIAKYSRFSKKIYFIPQGVDEKLFALAKSERERDSPKKILMVASLVEIKSIDHGLLALKKLRSCGLNIELHIVGSGHLKKNLIKMSAELGLEGHVVFHGVLQQQGLYDMYCSVDVLLICSKSEGRSSVVMESVAIGLPVVGSNVTGIREIISQVDGAVLYEYGNVSDLVIALKKIVLNNDVGLLWEKNRGYARINQPTWDCSVGRYLSLFNSFEK